MRSFVAGGSSVRFAMCSRHSIFGAGYSPRRATILSFGEKKEGKESALIQYHGHIHVFDHDGGRSLARPAGSNSGIDEGQELAKAVPTQPAAGASRRPHSTCQAIRPLDSVLGASPIQQPTLQNRRWVITPRAKCRLSEPARRASRHALQPSKPCISP